MHNALVDGLARHPKVILVGSDCPAIDRPVLSRAVRWLQQADVVIGPAADGGYYLLGARRVDPGLFRGIDWGSERVLAQTEAQLAQAGYRWRRLETLRDIDRPEDLGHWYSLRGMG